MSLLEYAQANGIKPANAPSALPNSQPQILNNRPSSGGGSLIEFAQKNGIKPAGQPMSSQPQPPQPEQDGFFSGLAKGIAKPFLEVGATVKNLGDAAGSLINGGFDQNSANQAMQNLHTSYDVPFFGNTKPAFTGDESVGQSFKKQFGYGAQFASTLMPGAGEVGLGTKALLYGGSNAIGEAGREATNNENFDPSKIGLSGALGTAIPVGGALLGKAAKFGGNLAAEALGKTTGTSADVIKEAFSNPNVMKFARASGGNQAELQEQALIDAKNGLQRMAEQKSNTYTAQLAKIKTNPAEMSGVVDDLKNEFLQHLQNYDVTVGKDGTLDFSNSAIEKSNALQKASNTLNTWTDHTASGLDRLKKKLGQFADQVPVIEQRGGVANILSNVKNNLRGQLNEKVPGYQEMTSQYHQASDLQEEIQKALSLKDSVSQDTAIKKLMSTVRDNQDLRKEFVNTLGGASGTDIRGKLAGAALAPWTPRGLTGKLTSGSAGAVGILHPGSIPLIGAYLAAASPRLVGEFTSLLGRVPKTMISSGKFSPVIQNGIRLILQKSIAPQNQ